MYVYINSESDFLTYDLMACALVSFSYPDMTGWLSVTYIYIYIYMHETIHIGMHTDSEREKHNLWKGLQNTWC